MAEEGRRQRRARREPIAEIETDKTTVEMESLASGTLVEIVCEAGSEVGRRRGDRVHRGATAWSEGQARRADADARRQSRAAWSRASSRCRTSTCRPRSRSMPCASGSHELEAAQQRRPDHDDRRLSSCACVAALREHPQFNSVWTPEGLLRGRGDQRRDRDRARRRPRRAGAARRRRARCSETAVRAPRSGGAGARRPAAAGASSSEGDVHAQQSRHVRRHRVHRDRRRRRRSRSSRRRGRSSGWS